MWKKALCEEHDWNKNTSTNSPHSHVFGCNRSNFSRKKEKIFLISFKSFLIFLVATSLRRTAAVDESNFGPFVRSKSKWMKLQHAASRDRSQSHSLRRTYPHTHTAHTHPHRNSFDKFWMKIYITATARYNSISHSSSVLVRTERLCTLLRSVRWHITSWVTFVCAVVVHLLAHI